MKYLVTGVAGYIGSKIVRRLPEESNYLVYSFDNFSTGKREDLRGLERESRFSLMEGGLRDISEVRKIIKGVDVVFHQAAFSSAQCSIENPVFVNDSNVGGTLNLLIAANLIHKCPTVSEGWGKAAADDVNKFSSARFP